MEFKKWLAESSVKFANIGEAMIKTLEFSMPEMEWATAAGYITKNPEVYNTAKRINREIVADSFVLSGYFRTPKIRMMPLLFTIGAHAVQAKHELEYDSVSGSDLMHIEAGVSLITQGDIPPGKSSKLRHQLEQNRFVTLSRRHGGQGRVRTLDDCPWGDKIRERPGFYPELDGPVLKTPLELAQWVKKVVERTDIGWDDDNEDEPEHPEVPTPSAGRLVGV